MASNNMMMDDLLQKDYKRSNLITKFMYSLFEKQIMCDVYLICGDGHIGAHKLVLGSNSVVLSKQFEQTNPPKSQQKQLYNPNNNKRQQHCNTNSFNQNLESLKRNVQSQDTINQPTNRFIHFVNSTEPTYDSVVCDNNFNVAASDPCGKTTGGSRRTQADQSICSLLKYLPQQSEYQQPCYQQPCYQHQHRQQSRQFQENIYQQKQQMSQQQPCDHCHCQQNIQQPQLQQLQQQQPCSHPKQLEQKTFPQHLTSSALNEYMKDVQVPKPSNLAQETSDRYLISSRGRTCPGRYNLRQQVENLKQTLKSKKQDLTEQSQQQKQQHSNFFSPLCNCINNLLKYNCDESKKYLASNSDNNNSGLKYNMHDNDNNSNESRNMRKDDITNTSNMYNLCTTYNDGNNINSNNINPNVEDEEMPEIVHISLEKYRLEVICVLIHFIYTGDTSHVNGENMDLLLQLSLELQMPLLHKACVKYIVLTINSGNVSFYLLLVDKFDMKNIRKVVLCFMLEHLVEVMQSHDFLKLPHPWVKIIMGSQEARGMISGECNNSEDQIELMIFEALVRWIDYDRANRGVLAPSLMGEVVHLEALSVQQLMEVVESIAWLVQMPEVRDILTSIYKAKLLMQKGQQGRIVLNVPSCRQIPCGITNFDPSTF